MVAAAGKQTRSPGRCMTSPPRDTPQVADSATGQERGYVGASVHRGHLSLMRLISALPRLRALDLRKRPDAAPGARCAAWKAGMPQV